MDDEKWMLIRLKTFDKYMIKNCGQLQMVHELNNRFIIHNPYSIIHNSIPFPFAAKRQRARQQHTEPGGIQYKQYHIPGMPGE